VKREPEKTTEHDKELVREVRQMIESGQIPQRTEEPWLWVLSFASERGFLGVVYIDYATSVDAARARARELDCDPGHDCLGMPIDEEAIEVARSIVPLGRLLDKKQAEQIDEEVERELERRSR
jgi:hypothetical protein